jgi:hypothetical protein
MKTLSALEVRRDQLLSRIEKLRRQEQAEQRHYDELSQHFHLGRVGAGHNTATLNKQRDRDLERAIERTKALEVLRRQVGRINRTICQLYCPMLPPKAKKTRTRQPISERLQVIRHWYLYGAADDPLPFPDVAEAEIQQARRLY